jgi:hypothetical protein
MLCGELAVLQAPMRDGFPFDPFSSFDDVATLLEPWGMSHRYGRM